MTTAADREIEKRTTPKAKTPWQRIGQIAAAIAMGGVAMTASGDATADVGSRSYYREHPREYVRNVVGAEPTDDQARILEAVRDNPRVSVRSGHKVGKSTSGAMLALWFYDCFDDARVIVTAPTSRQVDEILWREVKRLYYGAGRCVDCKRDDADGPKPCEHSHVIDGELAELARSGLKMKGSADQREIVGFTASESEAVAGVSGANILYLPDEASGIDDDIFEAIQGNRAGGGRVCMFSNPTRTSGEFYDSHNSKALRKGANGEELGVYKTIHVSSENSPNVLAGRVVVPGLATSEWVEEMRKEWGEDSPVYKVRVKGEFAELDEKKIVSLDVIGAAQKRWSTKPVEGRLYIGVDVAGEGEDGDESVFAPRRELRIGDLRVARGKDENQLLSILIDVLDANERKGDEPAIVNIDREGILGKRVYETFRDYAEKHPDRLIVVPVWASNHARQRLQFDRVRDELVGDFASWLRRGGAIPCDEFLEKEIHAFEWLEGVHPRKATPKKQLKKLLDGRSPDRFDACALSARVPNMSTDLSDYRADHRRAKPVVSGPDNVDAYEPSAINPYAQWGGGES